MPKRFIRLKATGEKVGWHPQHVWKVATDPAYEHVGFPKPVRLATNSIAFVEEEIDAWMQSRIDERDQVGFIPKAVNPRENRRRARERAEISVGAT